MVNPVDVAQNRVDKLTDAGRALEQLFAEHQGLELDAVSAALDRLRHTLPLARIVEIWDLSLTDVAAMFAVSRQAVAKWISAGVPAERATAVADLAAATDLLVRHLRRERIAAVVRRTSPGLTGRSLLAIALSGDTTGVLQACRTMFAFEDATA